MRRIAVLVGVAAVVLAAVVAAVVIFVGRPSSGEPSASHTVAIVDQLSLTAPGPEFVQQATELLERQGNRVDYYPGEQVTVDFFRNLPKHGYDLILVRGHAGRRETADGYTDEVALFTAEPYTTTSYVGEQRDGFVSQVLFRDKPGQVYFGIRASFVRHSMKGNFGGATVVLMGCDVLRGALLAQAFKDKGADAVVGWDGPISAAHTDAATERLLSHLLTDQLPIDTAVAQTAAEIGPDPTYGGKLLVYK